MRGQGFQGLVLVHLLGITPADAGTSLERPVSLCSIADHPRGCGDKSSRQGLGYLIIYGTQVFQLDLVIMSILILCVIASGLYALITLLEKSYLGKN